MNPAACLLQDGKCIAFAEEERFSRIKVSEGMFPGKAIVYCLSCGNLNLESIDRIAFGWDVTKYPWIMASNFTKNYFKYFLDEKRSFHHQKERSSFRLAMEGLIDFHPIEIRQKIAEGFRSIGFKGKIPKIEFIPHHLAHAYSAYFCSNFEKAGILTLDGHGEELCTQLFIGNGNEIKPIESFAIPHSLGWFYAAITEYLGFLPYRDEGKVMGLAAYGENRKKSNRWIEPLSKVIKIKNDSYELNPIYTIFGGHFYGTRFTDEFVRLIKNVDPQVTPVKVGETINISGSIQKKYLLESYVDLAWASQELLERAAIMLGKKLVEKYAMENLCIAGGVGLNCKMNGEILAKSGCKDIFVQPAANDAGTALGAAFYTAQKLGDLIKKTWQDPFLGPGFEDEEIASILRSNKLSYQEVNDPALKAADLLAEGKIIGWFQGRMESGPRALGNRSILANPILPEMKDRVNKEVKYREMWRPFCPSLIDEAKGRYIEAVHEARFMTVAYRAKEKLSELLPSVVHVDGSIRPQLVQKHNTLFHSLLRNFEKQSGHPVILNTSFNVRGEPIVCNPQEAIRCFFSNGLDTLILGKFILNK